MKADIVSARIAASKFIDQYSFETPEDIRIEDIAMDQGLLVREGVLSGAEARLVQNGENGIITINATVDSRRKRFAVAHEIGHWRMHKGAKSLDNCKNEDMVNMTEDGAAETEANVFAAELLMPRSLFFPMCRSLEPSFENLRKLSDAFDTSLMATALRFIDSTKENCFIVYSKDLRILWWKKNKSSLFIEKDRVLGPKTMANQCVKNGLESTPMKKVPLESWFSEAPEKLRVSISEQSMRLGSSSYVLSFLWLFEEEKGSLFD
jgi:Zn-dependent peptidase ImmA (M78 family)